MTNLHAKTEDCVVKGFLSYLSDMLFLSQGLCDLDLWPSGLKINRGHLILMTNLHAKYEDSWSKDS